MAKLRINGDSSGYVDLEAPNAASSSTLDLDQVPQKNAATKFDTVLQVGSSSTITNAYGAPYGYVFDVKANSGTQSYMSIGTPSDTLGSGGLVMGLDGSAVRITSRDDKRQIFSTNNIDRMTIHSTTSGGGAVTMPYQPSFTVKKTTAQTGLDGSNGAIINWDVALHNIGGHYNLSTNRFTAPVAGRYQFSAGGNIFHYSGTGTYYWRVVKNGGSGQYYAYTQRTDASNVWIQLVLQNVIIDLDANDYIDLFLHASNGSSKLDHSATNHWSFYSGHLLG
jgi:hypothetical protein